MKKVSILMATYNGAKYLQEQLESILNQSFQDWVLYISDDCSTDETINIIQSYQILYPGKISILSQGVKFGGVKENFAYLFEHSPESEYYMFSDQDDVWFENKIEVMVDLLEQQQSSIPLLGYCLLQPTNIKLDPLYDLDDCSILKSPKYKNAILQHNYIPGCTMMYNQALRTGVGQIHEKGVMHDWWLMMYASYFGQVIRCDTCLQYYRQHQKNSIGVKKVSTLKDILKTVIKEGRQKVKSVFDFEQKKLLRYYEQNRTFYELYSPKMTDDIKTVYKKWMYLIEGKSKLKKTIRYWKNFRSETLFVSIYDWLVFLIRFAND